jgi:hypothetical protein
MAISAVLAGLSGVAFAYLNQFMKDDPGWKFGHPGTPNLRVDFWVMFVIVFAGSYLIQWWHREN